MKTPKFRAWTEEGGVMYYDVYPFKDDTLLLSYDEIAFDEVPASDFIFMESTGLKDKNGVKIFEGDIVKYKFSDKYGYVVDIVCYDYERACFGLMDNTGDYLYSFDCVLSKGTLKGIEVIGNIWENKDLLGEEND